MSGAPALSAEEIEYLRRLGSGGDGSAVVLREASALMRERAVRSAEYDSAERWESIPTLDPDNDGWVVTHSPSHADYDTTVAQCIYDYEGAVSSHIASWHPAVALAVAGWLDDTAEFFHPNSAIWDRALAVARAYLGATP